MSVSLYKHYWYNLWWIFYVMRYIYNRIFSSCLKLKQKFDFYIIFIVYYTEWFSSSEITPFILRLYSCSKSDFCNFFLYTYLKSMGIWKFLIFFWKSEFGPIHYKRGWACLVNTIMYILDASEKSKQKWIK